jgi:hypothetical protein
MVASGEDVGDLMDGNDSDPIHHGRHQQ